MEGLEALTFDGFGPLVDWRHSIAAEALRFLGEEKGYDRDWNAFALVWRGYYQPAMERVRAGSRDFVKLDVLHRENLLKVLDDFSIDTLTESEVDHLNHAWHRLDPWPDVVAGMTRLRARYPLAALSNGNVALIMNMARRAGLSWEAILGGDVARAYKPMPAAYVSAADMMGLEPSSLALVAAHNDDLKAAASVGFKTIFVVRRTEYADVGQITDQEAWDGADLAAENLEDLADQLNCPQAATLRPDTGRDNTEA